jgi:hypothetical protein
LFVNRTCRPPVCLVTLPRPMGQPMTNPSNPSSPGPVDREASAASSPAAKRPGPAGGMKPKRRRPFYHRMLVALGLSFAVIGCALGLGILGYHNIAGFNWVDSILNASMILAGMGPVGDLKSDEAKLFASAYALFSGLVFIGATGILLTPVFHRVLHLFHIEQQDSK